MKKLFITAVFVSALGFANAQTMTSKNGTPILPEAGDWSIGFDATPALYYFGNLFNGTTNNSVNMAYVDSFTIVGKYMKDEKTAYRGKLALNFGSRTDEFARLNGVDSTDNPTKVSNSSNLITLGAGLQKFRGKGRLQGYYGAEALLTFGGGKTTNDYGQAIDATHTPTSGFRITEIQNGSTFGFGVRGFIGAEYFVAPKISIAAEYGWGIGFSSVGASEVTTESWDISVPAVKTTVTKGGKSSTFNVGVDNASGSIVLALYF